MKAGTRRATSQRRRSRGVSYGGSFYPPTLSSSSRIPRTINWVSQGHCYEIVTEVFQTEGSFSGMGFILRKDHEAIKMMKASFPGNDGDEFELYKEALRALLKYTQ